MGACCSSEAPPPSSSSNLEKNKNPNSNHSNGNDAVDPSNITIHVPPSNPSSTVLSSPAPSSSSSSSSSSSAVSSPSQLSTVQTDPSLLPPKIAGPLISTSDGDILQLPEEVRSPRVIFQHGVHDQPFSPNNDDNNDNDANDDEKKRNDGHHHVSFAPHPTLTLIPSDQNDNDNNVPINHNPDNLNTYEMFSPRPLSEFDILSPTLPAEFDVRSPRGMIPTNFPVILPPTTSFQNSSSSNSSLYIPPTILPVSSLVHHENIPLEPTFHENVHFEHPTVPTHMAVETDFDPRSPRGMIPEGEGDADEEKTLSGHGLQIGTEVVGTIPDPFGLRSPRPILAAESSGAVEPFSPLVGTHSLATMNSQKYAGNGHSIVEGDELGADNHHHSSASSSTVTSAINSASPSSNNSHNISHSTSPTFHPAIPTFASQSTSSPSEEPFSPTDSSLSDFDPRSPRPATTRPPLPSTFDDSDPLSPNVLPNGFDPRSPRPVSRPVSRAVSRAVSRGPSRPVSRRGSFGHAGAAGSPMMTGIISADPLDALKASLSSSSFSGNRTSMSAVVTGGPHSRQSSRGGANHLRTVSSHGVTVGSPTLMGMGNGIVAFNGQLDPSKLSDIDSNHFRNSSNDANNVHSNKSGSSSPSPERSTRSSKVASHFTFNNVGSGDPSRAPSSSTSRLHSLRPTPLHSRKNSINNPVPKSITDKSTVSSSSSSPHSGNSPRYVASSAAAHAVATLGSSAHLRTTSAVTSKSPVSNTSTLSDNGNAKQQSHQRSATAVDGDATASSSVTSPSKDTLIVNNTNKTLLSPPSQFSTMNISTSLSPHSSLPPYHNDHHDHHDGLIADVPFHEEIGKNLPLPLPDEVMSPTSSNAPTIRDFEPSSPVEEK